MKPPILALACLTLTQLCVHGQEADASSFEVASVKPASPTASVISCSGGPGTSDPGIWRCSNLPLAFVISRAFGFEAYQFSPRDTCCQSRFDFTARVSDGATKEQFQRMLQNLLVERFKLKLHHEQKAMAVYELTVGKKGPKLKESAPGAALATEDPWTPAAFSMGRDGYPVFPAGHGGLAGGNGHYRWTAVSVSTQEIVKTLSYYLGRPVLDATRLPGKYGIDMTWTIDTAWLLERAGLPDQIGELPDTGPSGPTLVRAVQDQLGLKLISKKDFGDIVVVDHVERIPTEN